ncbi:mobilization protein [Streptomyces daliensis]|uniref:Mobilization protein n=1 Tax=Streptomyces daliensis TaxID=299421 RepID=A0A8T4IT79_9ACTN|nr:mobilization protein [Streptomyces daliensis]
MIAKISSGKSTAGLIGYLYGPGRANEHTDPHLVASWDGFAPDPGRTDDFTATKKLLVADLDLHLKQARRLGRAPERHVWHCSLRAAESDHILTDEDWATIARRVVAATGIAPDNGPDGCRWIAVRHAPDHIHIAATTVRGDLRPARHWNDYLTADRELEAVETEYGLRQLVRGDRTAAKRPTRAEQEKAHRTRHTQTARERLRTTVRTMIAAATSTEEFLDLLDRTDGIALQVHRFPSGDVRGYKIALEGDTNTAGQPVWFAGSTLAPDLSLPKIRQRLDATKTAPTSQRTPNPWHEASAATERIPQHLDHGDDAAAQAHLAAFGEALDALPLVAPPALRPHLHQAATAFERATRSRTRAEHHHARALRNAIRNVLREPAPKDGAALAMFLDAALLVLLAAEHWHVQRHHQQQANAARQAQAPLQTAYEQAAAAPLAALAERRPPQQAQERHAALVRDVLPAHADQIINSSGWEALTAVLTDAKTAGHAPARLLEQAADERTLSDARAPANVLIWRINRLSQHPAPDPRAQAAQARSSATHRVAPSQVPASAAVPAQPQAARRHRR